MLRNEFFVSIYVYICNKIYIPSWILYFNWLLNKFFLNLLVKSYVLNIDMILLIILLMIIIYINSMKNK